MQPRWKGGKEKKKKKYRPKDPFITFATVHSVGEGRCADGDFASLRLCVQQWAEGSQSVGNLCSAPGCPQCAQSSAAVRAPKPRGEGSKVWFILIRQKKKKKSHPDDFHIAALVIMPQKQDLSTFNITVWRRAYFQQGYWVLPSEGPIKCEVQYSFRLNWKEKAWLLVHSMTTFMD